MNYLYGKITPGTSACRVNTLQGVENDYELHKGISRIDDWPLEAFFEMNNNFPDNVMLEDFVFNINNVLVVSERVLTIFLPQHLKNNEMLPIKIKNHKGRIVKEQYYILHQLVLQDCIDIERSIVRINKINPERFSSVKKLVIKEDQIDPEVFIFRMNRFPSLPIFKRDIAEKIKQNKFSGIQFGEISDWEGM